MSDDLPAGWVLARLDDLIGPGGLMTDGDWVESKDQDPNGEVRLIQLADVGDGVYRDRSSRSLTLEKAEQLGCTFLEEGDVLVSRMADPLGRACIFPGDAKRSATVVDVCVIRTGRGGPRHDWLVTAINSPQARARINRLASGTTRKRVSRKKLSTVQVGVPPLSEQRRIVEKIEALMARSRRAKEALDAIPPLVERFRQSVLAAAFRGDLTADWRAQNPDVEPADQLLERIRAERRRRWEEDYLAKQRAKGKEPKNDKWKAKYKQPRSPDVVADGPIPPTWAWVSLEALALIESGQTPKGLAEHSEAGGTVPWFRVGDMNAEGNEVEMVVADVLLSEESVRHFGLHLRPAGTVIFPKRGGAIATNKKRVLARPSAYDLNTMGIVPMTAAVGQWVWWWFQSVDLGSLNDGSTIPQINNGDIAPLRLPVPPLTEIETIIPRLRARLHLGELAEEAIAEATGSMSSLDSSILAKAFRGELVRQDPGDEPAAVLIERIRAQRAAEKPKKKRRRKRKADP